MAFTEFYVNPDSGSNLNAGSSSSTSAAFTYTNAVSANSWNASTGVFTVASGTPNSDMASMADGTHFASVYVTSGATVATFIGRITAVSSTTITVSLTVVSGAPPSTDGTGAITLKVDGAWLGPNATYSFPFNFLTAATMGSAGSNPPRVNFKKSSNFGTNGYDCLVTSTITHSLSGFVCWSGYTSSPGDGGRFIIDANAGAYIIFTISGACHRFIGIGIQNNSTGNYVGFNVTGAYVQFIRCSAYKIGAAGFSGASHCIECSASKFNQSNNATAGFEHVSSIIRCIAHNAPGSNVIGFYPDYLADGCIADTVGGIGFEVYIQAVVKNCLAYNCGNHGFSFGNTLTRQTYAENCISITNTSSATVYAYDLNAISVSTLYNCGSYAMGSGGPRSQTVPGYVSDLNPVTFASNPCSGYGTSNFTDTLAAAIGSGRGSFLFDLYSSPPTYSAYESLGAVNPTPTGGATSVNRGILTGGRM